MTLADFTVQSTTFSLNNDEVLDNKEETINIEITIAAEPQFLIGSQGQTLTELQHIVRLLLLKKLSKKFYVILDINNYQKKKIDYLKNLARDVAIEVAFTKKGKTLSPMPAYQRRIIHLELAGRQDVVTESQGIGSYRCIVINTK